MVERRLCISFWLVKEVTFKLRFDWDLKRSQEEGCTKDWGNKGVEREWDHQKKLKRNSDTFWLTFWRGGERRWIMAREGRQRPSSSLTSSFPLLSVAGCEELIPKNHEEREGSLVSPEPRVERERGRGPAFAKQNSKRVKEVSSSVRLTWMVCLLVWTGREKLSMADVRKEALLYESVEFHESEAITVRLT